MPEGRKMEWKMFFITFGTVFLAELGDKTQLSTMLFCTQCKSQWTVFFGSALALVLSSFLAVLVGGWLSAHVPEKIIKGIAGGGFVVIGIVLLYSLFSKSAS